MANPIPKRLRQEPLIETIWQVQFEPAHNQPLGDILPGVLFTAMRARQTDLQLNRLPLADIPAAVAALDPNLRHAAKYRIEAPGWPFLFHVGDRVITINCRRPYVGWDEFKRHIIELIAILDGSGLIPAPRQHSLRYIDLMTLDEAPSLASLRLSLAIGAHTIDKHPLQLRVELPDQGCIHVLQIVTPAQVNLPDGDKRGTLIDLETVAVMNLNSWPAVQDGLGTLHDRTKAMFFDQVLSSEAIDRMEPEY
jgi:uncharacterized protein (TIGR04255 family)